MSSPPRLTTGVLVMLLISTAAPVLADPTPVVRCNVLTDGSYRPVLIIGSGADKQTFHIGESGLSVTAVLDSERAVQFATRVRGGTAADYAYADCFAQGNAGGTAPAPAITVTPPPPPPPPPPTGGGGGGGCGSSYVT